MTPIEQNISKWVDELLAISEWPWRIEGQHENWWLGNVIVDEKYKWKIAYMDTHTHREDEDFIAHSPLRQAQLIIALVGAEYERRANMPSLSHDSPQQILEWALEKFNLSPTKFAELKARMIKEVENG